MRLCGPRRVVGVSWLEERFYPDIDLNNIDKAKIYTRNSVSYGWDARDKYVYSRYPRFNSVPFGERIFITAFWQCIEYRKKTTTKKIERIWLNGLEWQDFFSERKWRSVGDAGGVLDIELKAWGMLDKNARWSKEGVDEVCLDILADCGVSLEKFEYRW